MSKRPDQKRLAVRRDTQPSRLCWAGTAEARLSHLFSARNRGMIHFGFSSRRKGARSFASLTMIQFASRIPYSSTKLPLKCRANSAASSADINSTQTTRSSLLPVEVSLWWQPRSNSHRRTSSMRSGTWAEEILISTAAMGKFLGATQTSFGRSGCVERRIYPHIDYRGIFVTQVLPHGEP